MSWCIDVVYEVDPVCSRAVLYLEPLGDSVQHVQGEADGETVQLQQIKQLQYIL
jgi:hypothetical protein